MKIDTKFHFGEKVRITGGFYNTHTGEIKAMNDDSIIRLLCPNDENRYMIQLDGEENFKCAWVYESQLESIK